MLAIDRGRRRIRWGILPLLLPLILLLPSPGGGAETTHRRPAPAEKNPRNAYVGDAACLPCHQKESAGYQPTAHHLTSQLPDPHTIAGSFDPGSNVLETANPSLSFRMTADPDGFHQTAVNQIAPGKAIELGQRFDLVVGAGRKSQTYLYWKGDDLFELPVSWWAETRQWINSPGYEDGSVRFDRPIVPRCLECHGSSFESLAPPSNRFNRTSLVLSISCETCHGPGQQHVALYTAHSAVAPGVSKAIVNPATLPRARQLDGCALCHAGLGTSLAPALSFHPGDTLARYLQLPAPGSTLGVDVHGNQMQLLERSACFRQSSMTCSTCHNVHQVQQDAAAYSPICLQCHQARQCGEFAKRGPAIERDCVNCHMPLRKSEALVSQTNQQTLKLTVREHRIAVYPEAAR
ncbi:MAG TPA: multiheme c-type cytochrome [Acidobacteriaceae bacterium]